MSKGPNLGFRKFLHHFDSKFLTGEDHDRSARAQSNLSALSRWSGFPSIPEKPDSVSLLLPMRAALAVIQNTYRRVAILSTRPNAPVDTGQLLLQIHSLHIHNIFLWKKGSAPIASVLSKINFIKGNVEASHVSCNSFHECWGKCLKHEPSEGAACFN